MAWHKNIPKIELHIHLEGAIPHQALFELIQKFGHGTRAIEDPDLLDYIADNKIPLELCPMSNVRTGVVRSIAEHPIRKYFERGLIISVNTDDPKMFNTSLEEEYQLLEQECGFSKQEICSLILLSIKSSWLCLGS